LEGYVSLGCTANYEPNYFNEVLVALFNLDKDRFERLTIVLWKSYQSSDFYFEWLEEINHLLLNFDLKQSGTWKKLPTLFEEAYFYLISGTFLMEEISDLMHYHLTNWLELSADSNSLSSSSAILAWDEFFPSELPTILINEAKVQFKNSNPKQSDEQAGRQLLYSLNMWAEKEGLLEDLTTFMAPMLDDFNVEEASPSQIRNVIKEALDYI